MQLQGKCKLNCLLRQSNEKQELQNLTLINSRDCKNYITKDVNKHWCFDQRRKISERKSLGYHEGKIYILLSWPSNVWKPERQDYTAWEYSGS